MVSSESCWFLLLFGTSLGGVLHAGSCNFWFCCASLCVKCRSESGDYLLLLVTSAPSTDSCRWVLTTQAIDHCLTATYCDSQWKTRISDLIITAELLWSTVHDTVICSNSAVSKSLILVFHCESQYVEVKQWSSVMHRLLCDGAWHLLCVITEPWHCGLYWCIHYMVN